ncbi:hypothetical protein ATJ97_3289 [Georgenia soli]|uniref:EcsC family protein n=1 Tax=Georgenia soli TaxID=638953 RepID=A0A2A9ER77_9MICO|nr:hypothetical protein [Georgenia soli]PFG40755.1 hypothetical protein ATJ97_3289 [Georgenia soli]
MSALRHRRHEAEPPTTDVAVGTTADEQEAARHGLVERFVDLGVRRASRADDLVHELRREDPELTPAALLQRLEKRYLRRAALLGAAVGSVATVPGVGTVSALGLTTVQTVAFLSASARYVMAVASVHGVAVDDLERRRTLLMAALLGEEGAEAISGQLGLGTLYWAKAAITKLPIGTVKAVNKALTRRLVRYGAARGGALVLGRLAPFGVGVVIGYTGTRRIARNVVEGTTDAFGPAPATFGDSL